MHFMHARSANAAFIEVQKLMSGELVG